MYNISRDELTEHINLAKEAFIQHMFAERVISREQRDQMMGFALVVTEPSRLGSWVKRLLGHAEDKTCFVTVKVLTLQSESKGVADAETPIA